MESLKYMYIKIWQELYKQEEMLSEEYENEISEKVINLNQKVGTSEEEKQADYENFLSHLYENQLELLKEKIKSTHPSKIDLIPTHLKEYADKMLDKLINNAIYAKYMCRENEQYVIKKKNGEDVIVPVDYENTGVTLKNTIWCNGLHQFVQLKHNLQLTAETLTTSFISNLGYIKFYGDEIYGLTGTLGSKAEQNLLSKVYNVDFSKVPTYKEKIFEEEDGLVTLDNDWANYISLDSIIKARLGRSTLIICKTIRELNEIERNIKALRVIEDFQYLKIKTYADEEGSEVVDVIV